MGYSYYDTPEGEDCFKKMWFMAKVSGVGGVFASALDVLLISHPKGYGATIGRFGYITIPFLAIGTTYAATTCLSTSIRKKDDKLNYFIGGAAAGSIIGVWARSFHAGTVAAIFCGLAAWVKKDSLENEWEFFPKRVQFGWGDFRSIKHDFSLVKERPRQWKTPEEE